MNGILILILIRIEVRCLVTKLGSMRIPNKRGRSLVSGERLRRVSADDRGWLRDSRGNVLSHIMLLGLS